MREKLCLSNLPPAPTRESVVCCHRIHQPDRTGEGSHRQGGEAGAGRREKTADYKAAPRLLSS
jgi:hypothetical protein